MKKIVATAGATLIGVVMLAMPAQAGPVLDNPVYCGPGYHAVGGKCIKNKW